MKLLIVDDDLRQRELLEEVFSSQGFEVIACSNGRDALLYLENDGFDTVITDLKMPHISGTEVLKACHRRDRELPVIIITGHGTVDSATEAMKIGAYDYIQKPFDPEELFLVTQKAIDHFRLIKKNREMAAAIVTMQASDVIGSSQAMMAVKATIEQVAPLDVSVLIQGETGTGKELAARLIHRASKRSEERFLAINCGALNESLLESELFGHEKGSFTGADKEKKGLFELAAGGTLFLDEINSMSPALQVKLLRVLQEKTFMRVGGSKELLTDVRVISASNADLKIEVKEGNFRADLYYRLNVMDITMPPLRERKDDIAELAYFFLRKYSAKYEKEITSIGTRAMTLLSSYGWPGNVRELENSISRAVIMGQEHSLQPESLPAEVSESCHGSMVSEIPLMPLGEMEKLMIDRALIQTNGNKAKAAQLLGIDASTLWRKMKSFEAKTV
ncbi:MAG: sigma-54 dependent transcriptional regulator [Proteobacteria bacterium]|nr:sigma-54 dependent transcriptional regulator [Pseudomonadota bacterium]MBU1688601.1 sigma-54 dependent transcriptional regulator [Pseudomonadota bacterium]